MRQKTLALLLVVVVVVPLLLTAGLVLLPTQASPSAASVAGGVRITELISHLLNQLRAGFLAAIGQLWELICYLCPTETPLPQQLGALEDCTCDASVVDAENTKHFNPILSDLVKTAYFRYFKVSNCRVPRGLFE